MLVNGSLIIRRLMWYWNEPSRDVLVRRSSGLFSNEIIAHGIKIIYSNCNVWRSYFLCYYPNTNIKIVIRNMFYAYIYIYITGSFLQNSVGKPTHYVMLPIIYVMLLWQTIRSHKSKQISGGMPIITFVNFCEQNKCGDEIQYIIIVIVIIIIVIISPLKWSKATKNEVYLILVFTARRHRSRTW